MTIKIVGGRPKSLKSQSRITRKKILKNYL